MPKRLLRHLAFWIAFVCFKAFLNYSTEEPLTGELAFVLLSTQIFLLPVQAALVYWSFIVADRYMEGRWKLGQVLAALAVAFPLGSYALFKVNLILVYPILRHREVDVPFGVESFVYYLFTLLFVVGVAQSIRLFRKQYELKLQEARLEKEKTEAELKYLKGQINPHFLFNTLNNIYSLARKGSAMTAESVMKLATLMRFMLYESSSASIAIKDELRIIGDYIELEKLRYTDRLHVTYMVDVDEPEKPITPLLLIHFVENAFKHGAGESRAEIDIRVSIRLIRSILTAEISNPIAEPRVSMSNRKLGLENTKRILSLLYPAHSLKIETSGERFSVLLKIPLGART